MRGTLDGVRKQIPIPDRLGVSTEELRLESSFSIRFGTNVITINGEQRDSGVVGGRLDLLVTRNDVPVAVVEVKRGQHRLTDRDRDQAVSYARLVHPIAPVALLTNGEDWQLFDTLTKGQIPSEGFRFADGRSVALPGEARNEAISLFLGLSAENLLCFCEAQVREQMRPLAGTPQDLTRKFIPDLIEARGELNHELKRFEKVSRGGFLLLADSGQGKTSALCDYARRRLQRGLPTLFFAGGSIEKGLDAALKDEFGWSFTEQVSVPALVKRLGGLPVGGPMVVVIDAVDEWSYSRKAQSLLAFLRGTRGESIKVVYSCKSSAWEAIACPNGSDLGFGAYLHDASGVVLSPLTDEELFRAVRRYRKVFGLDARFEDAVLQEARSNPFLLRVMFVVGSETGQQDLTFSSREFFERYFDHVVRKTGDAERARATLVETARALERRETETVPEHELRRELSLSVSEHIQPELFAHNILVRKPDDTVSFYFQQLRDYLIAFRCHQWSEATPEEILSVSRSGITGGALTFFLRFASEEHVHAVAGSIVDIAEQYVARYTELRERHFPALHEEFSPHTEGPVGFLGEYVVPEERLGFYGFKTKRPNERLVTLVPVEKGFSRTNRLEFAGAVETHSFGSADGFRSIDIEHEVLEHEIIDRVEEIVNDQNLSVYSCPGLVAEEVVATLLTEPDRFPKQVVDGQFLFPWQSQEIRAAIHREDLRNHFVNVLIEEKRARGSIQERWTRNTVSYNPYLTPEDYALVEKRVEEAIISNANPQRGVLLNLVELERRLRRTGVYEEDIEIPGLPWLTEVELLQILDREGSTGLSRTVQSLIEKLVLAFLEEYATVVDTNFPTLANAFFLRQQMPVRVFAQAVLGVSDPRAQIDGRVSLLYEKLAPGMNNEVVGFNQDEITYQDSNPGLGRTIAFRGRTIRLLRRERSTLGSFLYWPLGRRPLTYLVYRQVQHELPQVLDALRKMETIPAMT